MTGNLVWLASYPKSGNTWTRAFLTAYLAGAGVPVDLDDLDSRHAADRQQFDRVIGVPSSELTADEIDRLRPEVYRALDAEIDAPMFLKTHDRWRLADDGGAVFPREATRRVILVVRNPLAVAPSYAAHYGHSVEDAIEVMGAEDTTLARQESRLSRQLPQPTGSWSSHALSWLEQSELPVTVVRYEDARADPAAEFSRVLHDCGIDPDAALVADALERTAFDRMRAAEAAGGFTERPRTSAAFFRRGLVDGWREELTPEQVARVRADHGPVMERLGYGATHD